MRKPKAILILALSLATVCGIAYLAITLPDQVNSSPSYLKAIKVAHKQISHKMEPASGALPAPILTSKKNHRTQATTEKHKKQTQLIPTHKKTLVNAGAPLKTKTIETSHKTEYKGAQTIPPASHKMTPASLKMAPTSHKMAPASHKMAPASQNMPPTSYKMATASHKMAPAPQKKATTSHKMAPAPGPLPPPMIFKKHKTQESKLKHKKVANAMFGKRRDESAII